MKKLLIIGCLFLFGCEENYEKEYIPLTTIRNQKCLISAKQVVPQMEQINCDTISSWTGESFCISRISKTKTVEFGCRKFNDNSWYANDFKTVTFDIEE